MNAVLTDLLRDHIINSFGTWDYDQWIAIAGLFNQEPGVQVIVHPETSLPVTGEE